MVGMIRRGKLRWKLAQSGGALAAALALGSGCAFEAGTDEVEQVGTSEEALNVLSSSVWKQLSIPVCWENPAAATSTRRGWVKDQITKTWQQFSQVRFTGWGTCVSTSKGLRLQIVNETASTGLLVGRHLDGVPNGVKLNLNMTAPPSYASCAATFGLEACVRATATHEFGHALGFEHEQMRTDNPNFDCFDLIGGGLGDTKVGSYDKLSIMHSCRVRDSVPVTLSTTDKLGLQAFYGHPSPAGIRKDAIGWDGSTFYFFFGKNLSQFSVSQDKTIDYFPAPISGSFPGWPTTSPWTTGADTAVDYSSTKLYFFSGNQYVRATKSNRTIDAGYPKTLPGGWGNWPSTWTSVDSAIRWTNDKIYLFRGSEYVRLTGTTVDAGYPKPITGNWNIPYTDGFDYGFVYPGGTKAYFFKGSEYVRLDVATDQVDPGYPAVIAGNWRGVTF